MASAARRHRNHRRIKWFRLAPHGAMFDTPSTINGQTLCCIPLGSPGSSISTINKNVLVATATASGHNANTFWQHPHQNNSGRTNLPNIFHQTGHWHADGWAQCLKLSRVRWRCLALTPHGPSKTNTNVPGRSSGTLVTGRAE